MKIAYLVNTYPRASHSFIRREIRALERAGFDIHRLAMRSDRAALVDAADIAEDAMTEHVLEAGAAALAASALGWMLRRPGQSLRALRLALRCGARAGTGGILRHLVYLAEAAHVARRCRDLRAAHLHAHFGTNSTTVAMLSAALGGPPFSFTVHGPEEFDAPVQLSLGAKTAAAAFTVAVSSYGRSQLCRWADPEDWPRLKVVHCGIEPWRFADPPPASDRTDGDGPRLVAIGRLAEQKGFGLLIEAMALAAPRLPGLHLTLVGDGPLRAGLEALISARGLGAQVTLTGWLDEARVRDALAGADALVLPSFAEGLPVVVMEAMASARPVIATAIAGLPELVTPDAGMLVPAGDAQALAEAIVAFAGVTPTARRAMGEAARTRALARHDIDREAARLGDLFVAAASAARSHPR